MRDFAFVQIAPGRVFVGWGPFEQLPFRRPGRPAFYVTDFFLDDVHPWRHPAEWEELSLDELRQRIGDGAVPEVEWEPVDGSEFAALFVSAQQAMRRGEFQKVVPVIFEGGRFVRRDAWRGLFNALPSLPSELWTYGYSYKRHGVIGATPELLFRTDGSGYRTMALAGTRRIDRAEELYSDAKERREHRMVVDDIVRRLAPFGNLEVEETGLLRLPSIAHLMTPIFFEENAGSERMSFSEMIRRLHPTAALGVSPRTDAGDRWLREADRGVKRRTFGAPFGVEREDHSGLAVVAIRNIHWTGEGLRIGSGAGLLAESVLEREIEELRQKREQVKALFQLRNAWETSIRRGA